MERCREWIVPNPPPSNGTSPTMFGPPSRTAQTGYIVLARLNMQLHHAIGRALCWMVLVSCAPTGAQLATRAPESGVRDAVATWVRAFDRHDLDGIANGFADDVVALYP